MLLFSCNGKEQNLWLLALYKHTVQTIKFSAYTTKSGSHLEKYCSMEDYIITNSGINFSDVFI